MEVEEIPYPSSESFGQMQSPDSVYFQLTFDDIIKEIEQVLRAQIQIVDKNTNEMITVEDPHGMPLINEKGMSRLKTIIRSKLNRNAPLSDLEDSEVRNMSKAVEFNIVDSIYDQWEEFGIPDITAATTIRTTVGDAVFINLKKAQHGRFLRHLKSTQQIQEVRHIQPNDPNQQKRRGLISRIFER